MIDFQLLQLQYEILNTPVSELAANTGVSERMMQDEITKLDWKQRWPDPEGAETQEDYIELSRKRLKVYSLAKDILLAQKYLELEVSIIKAANDIVESTSNSITPQSLKQLSALYKDMTSGTSLANLATMTLSTDESGIPMVIVRDVSGTK